MINFLLLQIYRVWTWCFNRRSAKDGLTNILVYQRAKIGDMVCSMAFLKELRISYPGCRITVMISPVTYDLLMRCPWVDEVIEVRDQELKGWRKFVLGYSIRECRFSHFFSLNPNATAVILGCTAGIPYRAGIVPNFLGFTYRLFMRCNSLNVVHYPSTSTTSTHLRMLGYENEVRRHTIHFGEPEKEEGAALLPQTVLSKPLIGLAIASANPVKDWPIDRFAELAKILSNQGSSIVICGGPKDIEASKQVMHKCPIALNFCGVTTLPQAAGVLMHADLLISPDSGLSYIAEAVGTDVLVIGGPCNLDEQGPMQPDSISLIKDLPCRPCSHPYHVPSSCVVGHRRCMLDVTVEEVSALVRRYLHFKGYPVRDGTCSN